MAILEWLGDLYFEFRENANSEILGESLVGYPQLLGLASKAFGRVH